MFRQIKNGTQTYKQALRGLFATGTSDSVKPKVSFPERDNDTKEKVCSKTGIESYFISMMSSITFRGAQTATMMKGIIGKKIGMTSIFGPDGKQMAVTIIEAGPCVVTQVKTEETDGYNALQLAFGDKKEKHATKAEQNHFAKANTSSKKFVKEFRNYSLDKALGETIDIDIFAEGDKVSVVGITKGKGFQGVVKRHGFPGVGEASHGQHDRQRAPGSIGGSSYPSRVFKGMRMAGRMGTDRVKLKGLKVVKIFADKNYLLVGGSVPGHNGSIVLIQK